MQIGTVLPTPATDPHALAPETISGLGQSAEALGFATLWTLDHLALTPLHSTTFLDPLVSLGYVASATDTIGLGTSILILPLRRTVNVASRAATLQHLSDGRLTLGLGAGYVPAEFDAVGVPMSERGPRLSEGIEVLTRLFDGETSFHGRFHDFEDLRIDPQVEAPTLLAGGGAVQTAEDDTAFPRPILERIVAADGWIAAPTPVDAAERNLDRIADFCAEQGAAEPRTAMLNYTYVVRDNENEEARRVQRRAFDEYFGPDRSFADAAENCLVGSPSSIREQLRAYEALGFDELVVAPATHDPDDLQRQFELIADEVLPHFA